MAEWMEMYGLRAPGLETRLKLLLTVLFRRILHVKSTHMLLFDA
jgi:hypothetical protein